MENTIDSLFEQGKKFSFENNSYIIDHVVYSKASDEFLAWVAGIEHYLIQNYDDDSGPVKLFKTLDKKQLSGFYKTSFERQMDILQGVVLSCKSIKPTKRNENDDNPILNLVKNPVFWKTSVILIGGSFTLGLYFGIAKFDKNLIELTQDKRALQDSFKMKDLLIRNIRKNSDSALNILGHMPYNEMHLDTLEFRKVQTTIENAGAALYLNK